MVNYPYFEYKKCFFSENFKNTIQKEINFDQEMTPEHQLQENGRSLVPLFRVNSSIFKRIRVRRIKFGGIRNSGFKSPAIKPNITKIIFIFCFSIFCFYVCVCVFRKFCLENCFPVTFRSFSSSCLKKKNIIQQ